MDFPKNFLWGAATSSHQVEGDNINDWSAWEKSEKRINFLRARRLINKYGINNFISGKAADHYNRYKQDFEIAKKLGHNATRFSIEWSRIEPKEGRFNEKEIAHYRQVLTKLKELKIEPFVTIWHWTIPLWLRDKGGWKNKNVAHYFANYVEKLSVSFKEDIKFWITLNEPEVYASISYITGIWPPQKKNPAAYLRVLSNLIKAHKQAYAVIKKLNPDSKVGMAKNNIYFEVRNSNPINNLMKKSADWWWNSHFLNNIKNHQDFIGLNHYFHSRINYGFNINENKKTSDLDWELYPRAVYHVLNDLKSFNKPIYITENGLADSSDRNRSWFIVETLKYVNQSIKEGADVRGYLHWSLMDNFEWDKGFWPRFGLLKINYKTFERTIRPSAKLFRDICLANGIAENMMN